MDRTDILLAARLMLTDSTTRLAALLRSQPHLETPVGGGSTWTVRESAIHVAAWTNVYADIASGVPSPVERVSRTYLAIMSDQLNADVAETDPDKVATLMVDAVERFLHLTAGRPGDQDTPYHAGIHLDLADLMTIMAADVILHGYDIACALDAPWPIDPGAALLALGAYAPLLGMVLNPETTAGHTAAYGIEVRGGPSLTVRLIDGVFALEPPGGPVDCEISADPIALMLVLCGRLSRWPAISLGLISAGGARPELAFGFPDLFVFP